MHDGADARAVRRDWQLTFPVEKHHLVEWRLFVALDQDTVALLQCMGDGALLELVLRHNPEMSRVIDGDDSCPGVPHAGGVFSRLVHLKPVRVVLVIPDPESLLLKPGDQPFD